MSRYWKLAALAVAVLACTPAKADQASALATVKVQPKVVDSMVDNSGNMYVLVKPEQFQWGHYAAAMCSVVKPHQARIFRMRIIELGKAASGKPPGTWERLAEADCGR